MIEVSSYISEVISDCGCEMAGITVSKAIAKWFNGKEMTLAMDLEMAIARLGVLAFIMSFFLKMEDRKKGYGLELPNIRKYFQSSTGL